MLRGSAGCVRTKFLRNDLGWSVDNQSRGLRGACPADMQRIWATGGPTTGPWRGRMSYSSIQISSTKPRFRRCINWSLGYDERVGRRPNRGRILNGRWASIHPSCGWTCNCASLGEVNRLTPGARSGIDVCGMSMFVRRCSRLRGSAGRASAAGREFRSLQKPLSASCLPVPGLRLECGPAGQARRGTSVVSVAGAYSRSNRREGALRSRPFGARPDSPATVLSKKPNRLRPVSAKSTADVSTREADM